LQKGEVEAVRCPQPRQKYYDTHSAGEFKLLALPEVVSATQMTSIRLSLLALAVMNSTLQVAPSFAADKAEALQRYGRHLARECTGCHRGAHSDGAIPALAGRPAAEIIELLQAYREGRKTNPVMVSVARSLDDEQSAAVAAYFSRR
jgi:cytochrome c553